MKLSVNWLREFANITKDVPTICDDLTMLGLEVEHCVPALPLGLDDIIIATITELTPHPTSKTPMQVAKAKIGNKTYQIVTAATNVALHQKVPVALAGTTLPMGKIIEERPLVGILSQGMFCSMVELGLAKESPGIWELPPDAPEGTTLAQYLGADEVINVALTPNRGDCYSVLGLARELTAKYNISLQHNIAAVAAQHAATMPVHLEAAGQCAVYGSRIIKNVNAAAPTPIWMVERLRRSGMRTISCVVDVTNYVMLELGQPLHAFDLAQVHEAIHVRYAKEREQVQLLDGQELHLTTADLVVADQQRVLALAGIMGGSGSAITTSSVDILLESAHFEPVAISKTARYYKITTESSTRFERGVDPKLPQQALERATELLLAIAGGVPGKVTLVTDKSVVPQDRNIALTRQQVQRILGITIADRDILTILQNLGLSLQSKDPNAQPWVFTGPSYRFDLTIAQDLCEEVARVYGYNNIPAQLPERTLQIAGDDHVLNMRITTRQCLIQRGYQEAITYSFIDPKWCEKYFPASALLRVVNPIASDMSIMRGSLLPGLLQTAQYNYQHQNKNLRIFELGNVFHQQDSAVLEREMLAGCLMGRRWLAHSWADPAQMVDFFDAKGDIVALLHNAGQQAITFSKYPVVPTYLHPARSVQIMLGGISVGGCGELHPQLNAELGIDGTVVLFEIDTKILVVENIVRYNEISKFPTICRDLSIIVDDTVTAEQLLDIVAQHGADLLQHSYVFDVYYGALVPVGQKSVALQLVFQHATRTLRDDEINIVVDNIVNDLTNKYKAKLRIALELRQPLSAE